MGYVKGIGFLFRNNILAMRGQRGLVPTRGGKLRVCRGRQAPYQDVGMSAAINGVGAYGGAAGGVSGQSGYGVSGAQRQYTRPDGTIVFERDVTQVQTNTERVCMKPKKIVVGHRMVNTVETVEVQNPSTMKMTTEYAEPYIKRAGYSKQTGFKGAKTQVVRRGQTIVQDSPMMGHGMTLAPMRRMGVRQMAPQQKMMQPTVGRGYTRIDRWKHAGDKQ